MVQIPAGTPVSSLNTSGQQHILITTQPVSSNAGGADGPTFMEGFFVEQPVVQATTSAVQEPGVGTNAYDSQPLLAKYAFGLV